MTYTNPVILSDYSDPDVIRVGEDFYLISSSFNYVPGVPVLHSKNLVEWEIINYVLKELPFGKFNEVRHGEGAWAPSLRYHAGKFYCLIPFPDEGIFVCETEDIYGEWSAPRPLLQGSGFEDPCPVWADGKCYVVFAFVKSRIGFNSKLAVFETDEELKEVANSYDFIYDGRAIAPKIEGPKVYRRGGYYHILAPAGGVKTGWQVELRSENIRGPYETRIILLQGDSDVNGPHQGALIDLDDSGERWAFMHFQDIGAYGRVVHLQPAKFSDGWFICGQSADGDYYGTPVYTAEYPVNTVTSYALDPTDTFSDGKMSPLWQTPANRREGWYSVKGGLRLNCAYYGRNALSDLPQLFSQKFLYKNFTVNSRCRLDLREEGDEAGFAVFGREYAYVCAVRRGGVNYLEIRKGAIGGDADETIARSRVYEEKYVDFKVTVKYEDANRAYYKFSFGGCAFTHKFYASRGVWTGARVGIYARSSSESGGGALFKYFKVTEKNS